MSDINIDININQYFALIGKPAQRISDYLRKHPNFPHTKVNTRLYTCNLIEAMEYYNGLELDTKEQYQLELLRKVRLEADLLEAKDKLNKKVLVDPTLAIEQIQRDYASVKDKIVSMKQVLINKCENKSLIELDEIFDKYITKTLENLSSKSKMDKSLMEDT